MRWVGCRRVALVISVVAVVGCSASGTTLQNTPEAVVTSIGVALHDSVWSYRRESLVGLTDDGRVAEVANPSDPRRAVTRQSPPLGAGRNLQISRKDDGHLFVPQPQHGKVAVVDLATLSPIAAIDAGPHPAYLSEDSGMRTLLALSADGTSVTPVDEHGFRQLPTAKIPGNPSSTIDGANRGRDIAYHFYGPSGIRYYKGSSSPPREHGSLSMAVASSAADSTAVTRSFVTRPDDDVLYAVDSKRGGEGMQVVAATRLPSPIRRIGTDDTRVYVATDREVAVLELDSFTGYPQGAIPLLRITDYRAALPQSKRSAPLSGMALGPHRVYLTFAGTPLVVSVAKPHL
jgi:hypothetical protein